MMNSVKALNIASESESKHQHIEFEAVIWIFLTDSLKSSTSGKYLFCLYDVFVVMSSKIDKVLLAITNDN